MNTQYRTRARTIRATDVSARPRPTGRFTLSALPLATGLVLLALLGSAPPAQAHNSLVSSTPAAGSTLTTMPERFSITTNEALLDISGDGTGFAMQVSDNAGLFYGDGCLTVDGSSVYTSAALGEAGTYLVRWQIISADGHPISDEFEFEWQPTDAVTASVGSSVAPNCGRAPLDNGSVANTANLADLLWVGGILVSVIVGVLVTFLVLGRKKRPRAGTTD